MDGDDGRVDEDGGAGREEKGEGGGREDIGANLVRSVARMSCSCSSIMRRHSSSCFCNVCGLGCGCVGED